MAKSRRRTLSGLLFAKIVNGLHPQFKDSMIDNIKIQIPTEYIPEYTRYDGTSEAVNVGKIQLIRNENAGVYYYRTLVDGLRFSLNHSGLLIENSWHTFHKGSNASDYNFFHLHQTYEEIEELIELDLSLGKILTLETAVNIETPYPVYQWPIKYKGKEMEIYREPKSKKIIGKRFLGAQNRFRWKVYLKAPNLVRFEVGAKAAYFQERGITISSPVDLLESANLLTLHGEILKKYDSTLFHAHTSGIETLSNMEREGLLLATHTNEAITGDYRRSNPNRYKYLMKLGKNALERLSGGYIEEIRALIHSKSNSLIFPESNAYNYGLDWEKTREVGIVRPMREVI